MYTERCDLALEATELLGQGGQGAGLPGVYTKESRRHDCKITTVQILSKEGEEALQRPCGRYVTIELGGLYRRDEETFERCVHVVAEQLREVFAPFGEGDAMIAGLGNRDITPDAIGPKVVSSLVITRHIDANTRAHLANLRSVSAISPGVLGITGLETFEIIRGVVDRAKPAFVVAVDALASRSLARLCTTIQIADTGITPGSGVGNFREAINKESLGLPVVAVGVPTVVEAKTIALDIMEETEQSVNFDKIKKYQNGLMVTPKDIDAQVRLIARIIAYAINIALHKGWGIEDVDSYLM